MIRNYEEIINTWHKRVKAYIAKHGEILKKFIDVENFFENLKQIRSMVHYKLSLLQIFKKLLKNNPTLKNTTLPTTYFRNNFKFTESVC